MWFSAVVYKQNVYFSQPSDAEQRNKEKEQYKTTRIWRCYVFNGQKTDYGTSTLAFFSYSFVLLLYFRLLRFIELLCEFLCEFLAWLFVCFCTYFCSCSTHTYDWYSTKTTGNHVLFCDEKETGTLVCFDSKKSDFLNSFFAVYIKWNLLYIHQFLDIYSLTYLIIHLCTSHLHFRCFSYIWIIFLYFCLWRHYLFVTSAAIDLQS